MTKNPTPIPANVLERLKGENEEVHVLIGPELHEIAVKRPGRAAYKRFKVTVADSAKRSDAAENLLRDCLLFPTNDELTDMFESRPALADLFGSKMLDLAGVVGEATIKKV